MMTRPDVAEFASLRRRNDLMAARLARVGESRRAARLARMVDRAQIDALALVTVGYNGGDIGRQSAGLPQRRWAMAVGLLRLARLVNGRFTKLDLPSDPREALQSILTATERAKCDPVAYGRRIPAYTRPKLLQEPCAKVAPLEAAGRGWGR